MRLSPTATTSALPPWVRTAGVGAWSFVGVVAATIVVGALGGIVGGIVGLILAVPSAVIADNAITRLRTRDLFERVAR
jgi:hypothetical protein